VVPDISLVPSVLAFCAGGGLPGGVEHPVEAGRRHLDVVVPVLAGTDLREEDTASVNHSGLPYTHAAALPIGVGFMPRTTPRRDQETGTRALIE
jgi:hypothetical protein